MPDSFTDATSTSTGKTGISNKIQIIHVWIIQGLQGGPLAQATDYSLCSLCSENKCTKKEQIFSNKYYVEDTFNK